MKNWLARLFGGGAVLPAGQAASTGTAAPDPATATRATPAAPDAPPDANRDASAGAVTAAYWHWLTAPLAGDAPAAARRRLLDELAQLGEQADAAAALVPRVPEVLPRLLRSLRDEAVSGADLARQVAADPVLVAETIREANSPFYRPASPVRTVDGAVMVLGRNGLRMLLARVAFRPVVGQQTGACARHVAPLLWRHAERCARAGALLAPRAQADPFEAYLAGLVLDVGLVVAFRLADRILEGPAVPQDAAFVDAVLAGGRALSARIARHWELPPAVIAALLHAGAPGLAGVLGEADRLARLRLLVDDGVLAPDDPLPAALGAAAARVFERIGPEARPA